jgi:hypothetical protein
MDVWLMIVGVLAGCLLLLYVLIMIFGKEI